MSVKFPFFGGGFWGGGECRFYFYVRAAFSEQRRGCRICVTVRLPVRPRGETMHWQANTNTPLSVTPPLNVPYVCAL